MAADTTSAPHSRHRSLLMVLLWCAAAKWRCGRVRLPNGAARCAAAEWRCGACGCRMSLRACDMWKGLRLCRAVFLCVLCSFIRIDSVLSPLCSPTVTCLLMNTALRPIFYFKEHRGAKRLNKCSIQG